VTNEFLVDRRQQFKDGEIAFRYDDAMVVRRLDSFVKLKHIEGDLSRLKVGGVLK